jgi:hypothetical protein
MRTKLAFSAMILGCALIVGCDNKDNSTVTPPAPSNGTSMTPPAVDTGKMSNAMNNAVDAGKTTADNMANSAKNAINNATPTTMPAMPNMTH